MYKPILYKATIAHTLAHVATSQIPEDMNFRDNAIIKMLEEVR